MSEKRTVLITGAAHGLGACMAGHAAQAGYRVGVMDLDADGCLAVADSLADAIPLVGDVCDPDSVEAALDRLGGAPSVLINNAGILRTGPLIDHSVEHFREVIDVNLTAVFIVARAAARRMRRAGGGCIINMASINGIHPAMSCGAYAAAKAGVMAMTQQMSLEWGEHNIRVNALAPGFIDSGMSAPFYENPEVRQMRVGAVPLGRLGTADDVARCALFLASEAAEYVNGQTLAVDGGVINSVLMQLPRE